jgi:hypothetical protein
MQARSRPSCLSSRAEPHCITRILTPAEHKARGTPSPIIIRVDDREVPLDAHAVVFLEDQREVALDQLDLVPGVFVAAASAADAPGPAAGTTVSHMSDGSAAESPTSGGSEALAPMDDPDSEGEAVADDDVAVGVQLGKRPIANRRASAPGASLANMLWHCATLLLCSQEAQASARYPWRR